MSCNPAIGGLAKGQIVKEMDVLGGIMPYATDKSALQYKILNRSKGKSVWSPRAQVDKRVYESYVSSLVRSAHSITLIKGEVVDLTTTNNNISGVILRDGAKIKCTAAVLTCGTFLNGLLHIGQKKIKAGRMGENAAEGITESLYDTGLKREGLKREHHQDWMLIQSTGTSSVLRLETKHPFLFPIKQSALNPKTFHATQCTLRYQAKK